MRVECACVFQFADFGCDAGRQLPLVLVVTTSDRRSRDVDHGRLSLPPTRRLDFSLVHGFTADRRPPRDRSNGIDRPHDRQDLRRAVAYRTV